jgi:hypothetical protein
VREVDRAVAQYRRACGLYDDDVTRRGSRPGGFV